MVKVLLVAAYVGIDTSVGAVESVARFISVNKSKSNRDYKFHSSCYFPRDSIAKN